MSLLICFEGNDAAGKATMSKMLAERLSRVGREAVLYSFPRYDTEAGKALKRHLLGETLVAEQATIGGLLVDGGHRRAPEDALWFQALNLSDKMEASGNIRAHLRAGRFVICDRWTPSAIAFGSSDGLDPKWLERVQEPLPEADLYILLDVSEEESLRRRPVLRDRYEKDREKQKIVRAEYKTIWRAHSDDRRYRVVDANGPSIEAVFEKIWVMVCAEQP